VVVIPLTGLALPCFCACTKLIPVEYILPSLFKVFSCAKTTVGQMNQEPRNILTCVTSTWNELFWLRTFQTPFLQLGSN
jgi:hypothetical protein